MEPSANREPAVQGEPNEGANLVGVGVVSNSDQHLGIRWVVEVEMLDEGANNKDLGRSPRIPIASFNRVPKEGRIPKWGSPLLVPFF